MEQMPRFFVAPDGVWKARGPDVAVYLRRMSGILELPQPQGGGAPGTPSPLAVDELALEIAWIARSPQGVEAARERCRRAGPILGQAIAHRLEYAAWSLEQDRELLTFESLMHLLLVAMLYAWHQSACPGCESVWHRMPG